MDTLRTFFNFYGGKWRLAPRYPAPRAGDWVVEPFAGGAGYALRHYRRPVIIVDRDPTIAGLWSYLVRATVGEISALPERVDSVDDVKGPQEARWLVGFWLNTGSASPCRTPSAWARSGIRPSGFWGPEVRARIASQVDRIRHWVVRQGEWWEARSLLPPSCEATWFVDPPYQGAPGRYYRHHRVDYAALGGWCADLPGQAIVCENEGATWLPFRPFADAKASPSRHRPRKRSAEVVWTGTRPADAAVARAG